MIGPPASHRPAPQPPDAQAPPPWEALRAELPACAAILCATVLMELSAWAGAWRLTGYHDSAVVAAVGVALLWVTLAGPTLAAGGRTRLAALVRGGMVADGSGVALLVMAAASPALGLLSAVKVYLVLAAVALAGISAVLLARGAVARQVTAMAAALVLSAILAGPFWIGGLLGWLDEPATGTAAKAAVWANPFYSATAALGPRVPFVWHLAPRMYQWTRLGTDVAVAPPRWWQAAVVYLAVAAGLGVLGCAVNRPKPAGTASGPPGGEGPSRDG